MTLPDGARGQALAVGLVVFAALTAWAGAAIPLQDWHANRAGLLERRQALAQRMEDVAASVPQLQRAAAGLNTTTGAGTLLAGATDALAGAVLQGRAETLSAAAGIAPSSIELLPAEPAGEYRRISLRLTTTGPWPGLIRLLQSIGQDSPRLLIDDLQVQQAPSVTAGPSPPVAAVFTIIGFRAGTQSPAAAR